MILIVADTGPINYLIQIGETDVLPRLVEKVVLPAPVQTELLDEGAPPAVRTWAATLPSWVEVRSASQTIEDRDISATDREAIALARELNASFLLMDDSQARRCATRLGVKTMGTLGLLEAAAARDFISLRATLDKLRATSCFLSDQLIEAALERDKERRSQA
jgi:predicted nucleic acid-binding protein